MSFVRSVRRSASTALASLVVASLIAAQAPRAAARFGYELGTRYTPHDRVIAWLDSVAAASDRITIERYGRTPEGRDLVLLFCTAPRNHARLAEIRERTAQLADPRGPSTMSPEDLMQDLPAIVWLSFNVHGNETSCTEAALRLVEQIAFDDDGAAAPLLERAVVVIDPCVNPDGRDRYVNWFNATVGKQADANPQTREHDEPWPGGRFNHYGFDLNRDWAFMSQAETRGRLPHLVRWNPQVHVDFHEMGPETSYFFFPADRPINDNIPHYTVKWGETFGRGNAAAFDRRGWEYYTAESFDLFYPGYGDSWPSLQGAIGMTYEQAGGPRGGAIYRRRDDVVLSLADRVEHHFVAAMATIRTAADNRAALIADWHGFRKTAVEEGRGGDIREFIILPGRDAERMARLVELLGAQGIEVRRAAAQFTARDVHGYDGVAHEQKTLPEGALLVSLAQPTKRLVKTLLEPRTTIKELYFYDVSAWSLPFAFGLEAYWTGEEITVDAPRITAYPLRSGGIEVGESTYGWLWRWDDTSGVRTALALLARGASVRVAGEDFTHSGVDWPRGTAFLPRGGQSDGIETWAREVAEANGARLVPVATGMTEKGIDLGSGKFLRLRSPRIALIGGEGMGVTSFGAARFLLEELYDVPHSIFDADRLGSIDLIDYTAVVLPDGSPRLDEAAKRNLGRFVEDGGVLLAFGRSARAVAKEGQGLSSLSTATKDDAEKKEERILTIEQREEEDRRESTPGAIFAVDLDPAHPLAFGYESRVAVFLDGTLSFDPKVGTPVARFAAAPPLSGYILPEKEASLRGRAFAAVERRGRGQIVLLADDPNFRSAWHGLSRLFLNALLLLPRH